jgi:hypothetical protein
MAEPAPRPPAAAAAGADVPTRLASIEHRLGMGDERMASIERELASNTEVTREIRDLMTAARVGFRVLGGLGTAAKWLGGLATAGLAIWALWQSIRHGTPPSPGK